MSFFIVLNYFSQSYLSDIEKGRTMPSIDKLSSICTALEISLGDFFGQEYHLYSDIIQLMDNVKKLTDKERQYLNTFIEEILKRN
ncbi:helix-turn-helix domain-containing protein [Sporolactobacillus terrae]|uniref:helix-turn-helix domain-containing protein n=1 Tax=Sporolactobacillus terrae TaxID=269673 RepID=UPI0012692E91